ncbi:hypothetical protein [Cronobacter sakazakii]|uniref:hypothetical protein n=1 Tax=Cronobacter sakazakii TaxID=28141 RepID=UPI0010542B7F|nr:hypothetical protein [Cronobacter sakazakii]EGT0042150.1 hypothetical protein [Cronobacter sakazakii]EKY2037413.1 hypothetical protein [Cronobacter sakazakii]ELY3434180.1 hypothetical protein [Cronobacter sakazakii]KAB0959174.1 hypothetical protein FZI52_19785 [Cronobacter sakazakii]MBF4829215.1 hypothetical protein [Cronobacter sakazakii]
MATSIRKRGTSAILKASIGNVEIVLDKAQYQIGDVAKALITFPEPINEALLTLERDRVNALFIDKALSGKYQFVMKDKCH